MAPLRLIPLMLVALAARPARAEERPADPSNYRAVLAGLQPGDVLSLAPGAYRDGLPLSGLSGRADAPIVITGPAQGARAVFIARDCCNTVSLRDVAYVTVRHLDLEGGGLPVDGVKAEGDARFAHHVVLEDLNIRGHGANQQIVGVNTKCPAWDWQLRDLTIDGAGTGIYLGNSDGTAPFVRGLLERIVVRDPIGYAIQIKHQVARPALKGLPTEPSVTVLRGLVLGKAQGASMGNDARPNLLIGDVPPSGPGSQDRYEVYASFFFQNATDGEALVQAEGELFFHDNVFVNGFAGPALALRPQNGRLRGVRLARNTIYVRGSALSLSGLSSGGSRLSLGNVIYAGNTRLPSLESVDDVTGPLDAARTTLAQPGFALPGLDLSPRAGALQGPALARDRLRPGEALDRDFDGTLRTDLVRGAYEGPARWPLALAQRPTSPVEPPDAGPGAPDATTPLDAVGPSPDAEAPVPDASAPRPDAGASTAPQKSGCRCTGSAERLGSAPPLLALLVVSFTRRTRIFREPPPASC